jgi:hypothetical protein
MQEVAMQSREPISAAVAGMRIVYEARTYHIVLTKIHSVQGVRGRPEVLDLPLPQ